MSAGSREENHPSGDRPAVGSGAAARSCLRCGRTHRTGLAIVRPLCPPCWIARDHRRHPELAPPPQFAPQDVVEQLIEDWLQYAELIQWCVERKPGRMSCRRLAAEERWLYAVTQLDAVTREQGFFHWFAGFHARHRRLVMDGLDRLEAPEHKRLYLQAERAYRALTPEQVRAMRHQMEESCDGPFFDLSCHYFELEDLAEKLAIAAWQAGLIVENRSLARR
jgi:hypothetical protein